MDRTRTDRVDHAGCETMRSSNRPATRASGLIEVPLMKQWRQKRDL